MSWVWMGCARGAPCVAGRGKAAGRAERDRSGRGETKAGGKKREGERRYWGDTAAAAAAAVGRP